MQMWIEKVAEAEVPALQYTEGGPWVLCLNVTKEAMFLKVIEGTVHAFLYNAQALLAGFLPDLFLFEVVGVGEDRTFEKGMRWINAQDSPSQRKSLSKNSDHRGSSR